MFDEKYLNHKFIPCDKYGLSDFICEKCNVIIYHSKNNELIDCPYSIVEECDENDNGELGEDLHLICEEWIIKGIIE